jgi:DNA adenine methylase
VIRSPFFYVGDKAKLMPQLVPYMPAKIDQFVDVFAGGGSAFLNVDAKHYFVNDIETRLIDMHQYIASFANKPTELLNELFDLIDFYGLTCSYRGKSVPESVKMSFPKTYFARHNKDSYLKLRADFNSEKESYARLYLLIIYGFNHMLRFNSSGDFNLPVGNVDFNKNVVASLTDYLKFMSEAEVTFCSLDFQEIMQKLVLGDGDFVYLDPPYLISHSEYNKIWSNAQEAKLYELLDALDSQGIKFGLSNMLEHKGLYNKHLDEWSRKYNTFDVKSNYISFNDNSKKPNSREVYVTNHV